MSLAELAERSEVSKAMLNQIEMGKSSPTIALGWKIANGLGVPFGALLGEPMPGDFVVHRRDQVKVLFSDNSAERFIDRNNNGTLDVGDSLRGIFGIDTIESPQIAIGGNSPFNELTGIFQTVVTAKTFVGVIGGIPRYDYTFGADPAFAAEFGAGAGAVGLFFEDSANDFKRQGCASFAACEATATGGNLPVLPKSVPTWYLGEAEDRHVWLIYRPELAFLKSPEAALTLSVAKAMQAWGLEHSAKRGAPKAHLVFAPAKYLSNRQLKDHGIDYAPLPFALYREA